jgi:hypothetical protein
MMVVDVFSMKYNTGQSIIVSDNRTTVVELSVGRKPRPVQSDKSRPKEDGNHCRIEPIAIPSRPATA